MEGIQNRAALNLPRSANGTRRHLAFILTSGSPLAETPDHQEAPSLRF